MTLSDDDLRRAFTTVNLPSGTRPTADEIQAALDGTGDESARLATLAQLTATPEGRAELNMLRALRDGFIGESSAAPALRIGPADTRKDAPPATARRAPRWSTWAGLVAAAALLVSVSRIGFAPPREDAPVYRSASAELALASPADGARGRGDQRFVWRHVTGASYDFELFTANGTRVARLVTTDSTVTLSPLIPAGDYRWWVTAQLDDATQVRSATRRLVVQ